MEWLRKIVSSQWLWLGLLSLLFLTLPFALKRFYIIQNLTDGIYIATGLVVLWYTVETSGMRREMVAARKARERPEVILRLAQITTGFFDLVVENVSDVPARDITFSEFPDLLIASSAITGNIGFLTQGIAYLAPKESRKSFFLNYPGVGPAVQQSTIEFVYTFQDERGEVFPRTVRMNLASYYNNLVLGPSGRGGRP